MKNVVSYFFFLDGFSSKSNCATPPTKRAVKHLNMVCSYEHQEQRKQHRTDRTFHLVRLTWSEQVGLVSTKPSNSWHQNCIRLLECYWYTLHCTSPATLTFTASHQNTKWEQVTPKTCVCLMQIPLSQHKACCKYSEWEEFKHLFKKVCRFQLWYIN